MDIEKFNTNSTFNTININNNQTIFSFEKSQVEKFIEILKQIGYIKTEKTQEKDIKTKNKERPKFTTNFNSNNTSKKESPNNHNNQIDIISGSIEWAFSLAKTKNFMNWLVDTLEKGFSRKQIEDINEKKFFLEIFPNKLDVLTDLEYNA